MSGPTKPAPEPDPLRVQATSDAAGVRLDTYLAQQLPQYSRSRLQGWIRAGRVQVDGMPQRCNHRLKGGEALVVNPASSEPARLEPADIPLDIVYRDDDLLILNKPAGMVVHPGSGTRATTLVHALLGMGESLSGVGGPERPGIVHRLDKGTSGLMVVARNDTAHRALSDAFQERRVEKEYRALCWGVPRDEEGLIDLPLGRNPRHRTTMSGRGRKLREARTRYRVLTRFTGFALLSLLLETGRTHQIRAHLKSLGHPVVGDDDYGGGGWRALREPVLRQALGDFDRLALHAYRLAFHHPTSNERMEFTAPLPHAFAHLVGLLEAP
ncbi:MAG: RluA family pseudouridine synthase [Acidobacteria bacterium]|nr:MAG: RluA family pseudouridine synthase [Acidobacteriota bacterium]